MLLFLFSEAFRFVLVAEAQYSRVIDGSHAIVFVCRGRLLQILNGPHVNADPVLSMAQVYYQSTSRLLATVFTL